MASAHQEPQLRPHLFGIQTSVEEMVSIAVTSSRSDFTSGSAPLRLLCGCRKDVVHLRGRFLTSRTWMRRAPGAP